jgi:endonuclease G, mitochondrial
MLSQRDLIGGLECAFGPYKTYQVTVRSIADLTGLDFGRLLDFNPKSRRGLEGIGAPR